VCRGRGGGREGNVRQANEKNQIKLVEFLPILIIGTLGRKFLLMNCVIRLATRDDDGNFIRITLSASILEAYKGCGSCQSCAQSSAAHKVALHGSANPLNELQSQRKTLAFHSS